MSSSAETLQRISVLRSLLSATDVYNLATLQLLVETSEVLPQGKADDHESSLTAGNGDQSRLVNRGILSPEHRGRDDTSQVLPHEIQAQPERATSGRRRVRGNPDWDENSGRESTEGDQVSQEVTDLNMMDKIESDEQDPGNEGDEQCADGDCGTLLESVGAPSGSKLHHGSRKIGSNSVKVRFGRYFCDSFDDCLALVSILHPAFSASRDHLLAESLSCWQLQHHTAMASG